MTTIEIILGSILIWISGTVVGWNYHKIHLLEKKEDESSE